MTLRGLFVFVLGLCCAGQSAPQQEATSGSAGGLTTVIGGVTHTVSFTMRNSPPLPANTILPGAPYSAEEVEERVQTLADGSRLTQKWLTSRTYRDSEGRLRREMIFPQGADPDSQPAAAIINILDPAANVEYKLDQRTRIAHRYDLSKIPSPETMVLAPLGISYGEGLPPSPPPRPMPVGNRPATPAAPRPMPQRPPGAAPAGPNAPTLKSERLGTEVIDGLTVEGTRMTRTIPSGTEGNDRPMVTVSEQWSSPEIRVTVLSKTIDPRTGETTRTLIHLSRAEPDISLFQPPPDYLVVDEKVSVTINHRVLP